MFSRIKCFFKKLYEKINNVKKKILQKPFGISRWDIIKIFFKNSLKFQWINYYFLKDRAVFVFLFLTVAIGVFIAVIYIYQNNLAIILTTVLTLMGILISLGIYWNQKYLIIRENLIIIKQIKFVFKKNYVFFHLLKFEFIFLFIHELLKKNKINLQFERADISFNDFEKSKKNDEEWIDFLGELSVQCNKPRNKLIKRYIQYFAYLEKKAKIFSNLNIQFYRLKLLAYKESDRFKLLKNCFYERAYPFFRFSFLEHELASSALTFERVFFDTKWNEEKFKKVQFDLEDIFKAMREVRNKLYSERACYEFFDYLNSREEFLKPLNDEKKKIQNITKKIIGFKPSKFLPGTYNIEPIV